MGKAHRKKQSLEAGGLLVAGRLPKAPLRAF